MRSTKMEALALEEALVLEEALWLDDSDLLSGAPDIQPRLEDVSDDDSDEIGLRRLFERPEALSPSLPDRLGC